MTISALWQQLAPVAVEETKLPRDINPEEAAVIVDNTQRLLAVQGFCLWKCEALRGDTIRITNNPKPGAMPEYSPEEISMMADLEPRTMRLIHRLKIIAGAQITSVWRRQEEIMEVVNYRDFLGGNYGSC